MRAGAATLTSAMPVEGTIEGNATVLTAKSTIADGKSPDSWHTVDALALRPTASVDASGPWHEASDTDGGP